MKCLPAPLHRPVLLQLPPLICLEVFSIWRRKLHGYYRDSKFTLPRKTASVKTTRILHVPAEQSPSKSERQGGPPFLKIRAPRERPDPAVAVSDGVGAVVSETQTMGKEAGREGRRGQWDGQWWLQPQLLTQQDLSPPASSQTGVGHGALPLPREVSPHLTPFLQMCVAQHQGHSLAHLQPQLDPAGKAVQPLISVYAEGEDMGAEGWLLQPTTKPKHLFCSLLGRAGAKRQWQKGRVDFTKYLLIA